MSTSDTPERRATMERLNDIIAAMRRSTDG